MSIQKLREFLTAPVGKSGSTAPALRLFAPGVFWWFFLSLVFAALCGTLGLRKAFHSEYVVQDDARQHVFWMARFVDRDLFPHDLIADYFQSVAPHGYTALYRLIAGVGLNPLLFSKLLPLILGLIATAYCFGLSLQILPVPLAGFAATVLLNENLWMKDDLVSATPRAFAYPLFLAFLYYLSRRSLMPTLVVIALQGLFYPQVLLISAGILILRLLRWEKGRIRFSPDRSDYLFCLTGLGVILFVSILFALKISGFGPTITAAQAKALPEFRPQGRVPFFYKQPWIYWITGSRSGLLPQPQALFNPKVLLLGLLLPAFLRFPSRFELSKSVGQSINLLPQILLTSVGMFFTAHALLFRLHLPSRYTQYTFRIVMALAAGALLVLMLDPVLKWTGQNPSLLRRLVALGSVVSLGALLVWSPLSKQSLATNLKYKTGRHAGLYEFFSRQPKGTLIASLTEEVNLLPTFSQRPILVGAEYAIPYHTGYYCQFRQRTRDLIGAQYSPNLHAVQDFIRKYGIDFWLIERKSFGPDYVRKREWLRQFPEAREAANRMEKGEIPALAALRGPCSVYEDERFVVLDARCIVEGKRATEVK